MKNKDFSNRCDCCLQYHITFYVKDEFDIKGEGIEELMLEILQNISRENKYEIEDIEISSKYVSFLVEANPTVAPIDIVRTIKSFSTIELLRRDSSLKKFYSVNGSFWKEGYRVATAEYK